MDRAMAPVVFIGVDAANTALIQDWAREGVLPTFARLMREGLWGATRGLDGLFVGSTWPSIYTGASPARHGVHSLRQIVPGTYGWRDCIAAEHGRCEPFWRAMGRAGRRLAILDIPHSRIDPDIAGIQTVEWGGHDAHYGFGAAPAGLAEDIIVRFGPSASHPIDGECDVDDQTPAGFGAFRDRLVDAARRKAAMTIHYLGREPWDLLAQVFTETHCVGHQAWHIHQREHRLHDPAFAAVVGDPVRDVLVAVDAAIGEIIDAVPRGATVIVLVSHGMGPCNVPWGTLTRVLLGLGVAVPPDTDAAARAGSLAQQRLRPILRRAFRSAPAPVQALLAPLRTGIRAAIEAMPKAPEIDPRAGAAFVIHDTPSHGGVRVNLAGREPEGIVPAGEMRPFLERLAADLHEIRNTATGAPAVRRTIFTDDAYPGPMREHLPDLLVEWDNEGPVPGLVSPRLPAIDTRFWNARTGHHRSEGLIAAFGPGITPGRLNHRPSIMDVAPTLAALLDIELPDADGAPIAAIAGARQGVPAA
jgi:predicted AlkP superfamily phosphohydrolase/phosphomutase